ncbi:CBS domain-containing protein [bacterium]|nr:CBS domain-containing protein [bacterium]
MKARNYMTRDVVTVSRSANIAEIAQLLREHRITGVPVVDDDGRLLGVVTHEELINVFLPNYLSMFEDLAFLDDLGALEAQTIEEIEPTLFLAEDIMHTNPHTVGPGTSMMKVAAIMLNNKHVLLPVVDSENKVVGVINRSAVSSAFTGAAS